MFKILAFSLFFVLCESVADKYDEKLLVKPLESGNIYTVFKFSVEKDIGDDYDSSFHHFHLFPRSLGEILYKHQVQELHFSLTHGLWRYEKWGYPARSSPPGAELWALFKGNMSDVPSNWKRLTNILSGQFCASLNFIDDTNTAMPKFSFRPEGSIPSDLPYNSSFIRYSSLPPEIICTENLTPFRKLLPCSSMAGLSTLLNALNIFNGPFVSLAVDVQSMCKDKSCSSISVQLTQTVSVVFDSPVLQQLGKQDWSFVKLFGSGLFKTCPLASTSMAYVDISSNKTGIHFSLSPKQYNIVEEAFEFPNNLFPTEGATFAVFDLAKILQNATHVNVGATHVADHIYGIVHPPLLYADRKITGYGQEHGGIHCTFYNNHPNKALKIIYFDLVPWYLRLYSHTLVIKEKDRFIVPDHYHYQPAKDRKQPHHMELVLTLPPKSSTELSIEFDFAFLKWTEYPPDANHGFYVGSAIISSFLDTKKNFSTFPVSESLGKNTNYFLRLHTQILLVSLPTPDFSMPYNVICLTCTVVALAFGPIHNITTKSLYPLDETENESFLSKLKGRVKNWWKGDDKKPSVDELKESSKDMEDTE